MLYVDSLEIILTKLEQAKSNNETLKVSYTTVLFAGSSGVGKTSLLNKLNKKPINKIHHSTGVAKSKHTICIKTTAVVKSTKGLQWIDLDYDSMIGHLNKHLHTLQFSPSKKLAPSHLDRRVHNPLLTDSLSNINLLPSVSRLSACEEISEEVQVDTNRKVDLVAVDIANANSSNVPSLGDVWNIINFLDTGGQPEFVSILPAISSSIALTFIVFDLSKNLDSLVHIQHNVNGDPSFEPYYLDCTNLEFIKHLMVSSESFDKNSIQSLELKCIHREDCETDPKICYVGTHALNVSEEQIQEIDCQLSSIASELELHQRSFWLSPKQQLKRLFPVENFPDDKEKQSFDAIIEVICDNIQKQAQSQEYYEVPITWFMFLLKIQKFCQSKEISYVSFQEAVDVWVDENLSKNKVGNQLNVAHDECISKDKSDVHNILLFFHFMGMLFYYHKVKGMCEFVFIDRQWLFEKLTEIVAIKFTKSDIRKDINAEDLEKFTMEGRLNINIIKSLKLNLQGIQPINFIHLLDHLNIIAPIDSELKEYFMPCVLPNFSSQKSGELDKFYGTIQHVPLLVGLRNGPMPYRFFCHLIVELLKNMPTGWNPPLLPTSRKKHVYNNLITFPILSSGHAVSLFYKIGFIEIQVRHKQTQPILIHSNVQCEVDKALRKISNHLHMNKEQLCYGFYCKCEGIEHFAKLKEVSSPTKYICCGYGLTKLTEDHRVWLQVAS